MKAYPVLLVIAVTVVACTTFGTLSPMPSASPLSPRPSPSPEVTVIRDILADPARYEGREVIVVAYYRGWDLFGETGGGPPRTRSDVAVADATGAIYIVPADGAEKILEALPSPQDIAATDILLRLRGKVERTPDGRPYLAVTEVKRMEGLPPGIALRVRRTGGIAGFDQELTVFGDGTAYFTDRRLRQRAHFQVDSAALQQAIEGLRPFLGQGEVGVPVPDGFAYMITVQEEGKTEQVTFYEGRLPESAAQALQPVRDWFGQGQGKRQPVVPSPVSGPEEAARRALAEKLGISTEEVTVVSSEEVDWPDTSLGCPQPGMMYAQVITPGYRIILEAQGQQYEAHTDRVGGQVVFCSAP